MTSSRSLVVYGVLFAAWAVIAGWQVAEHVSVRRAVSDQVILRARDITSTMALVMRSQRWFGTISRERMESALREVVHPGDVDALALVNVEGETVAAAGREFALPPGGAKQTGVHFSGDAVMVVNLVDLGTNVTQEATNPRPPTIVLPREQLLTNFPPPPRREGSNALSITNVSILADGSVITNVQLDTNPPPRFGPRPPPGWFGPRGTNTSPGSTGGTNATRTNRTFFSRPFWMKSEAEYQAALKKSGAHNIVIVMSAAAISEATGRDLWLRSLVCLLAGAAAGLAGFAWRNTARTHDLQLRLVKASEMNTHLKQMNLAAAGLAHETRNPLNIIRGLAQLVSKQGEISPDVREKTRAIVEETDRVTAQLNEFINYSRPREVRRAPVPLARIAAEITRTLAYDTEEKSIQIKVPTEELVVEADEQLLRQALFNLLLNAVQAADTGGLVEVAVLRSGAAEAVLEVRDNGPGVPAEHRAEIFKPYFTTHQRGTGLGLAVVQQIVSAHGWTIECADSPPRGAVFRIRHLKVASRI